ncbi:NAD(P)/FAD-dependent oxidoreductase [Cryobacterium sp. SO1]|uniref:NAD(P)/FAD-dependent oxidoreductase n=1 Tax=Cryobacterium sp. SO1 TaxID=1897061 RepID=UPI001023B4DA|nr:NAD(P)/FAD-dependent oxidoreductase [Cryobacterium sp. SO1]RZI34259.1 Baeyer-Villiger flavin-containing monooxygenase [Cryobacterium sp. SO1]
MGENRSILDTVVVGAGPAGVGTALALQAVEGLVHGVIERGQLGETFLQWPEQLTFLTPSFTGNGFGATDLNSVHPETSPAFSLGVDYPTGAQYARYLRGVAKHFSVPVMTQTEVSAITATVEGFTLTTSKGTVLARTVVWAGGEFHNPRQPSMAGSEHADHSSAPAAWTARSGQVVVIGGYESGLDVACFHVEEGASVTVVDPDHPWQARSGSDPSFRLAPRTRQRVKSALATGRLTLSDAGRATGIRPDARGVYTVALMGGIAVASHSRPVLATGFGPGLGPAAHLFEDRADGWPLLDDNDESTVNPGIFLSGAALRHGGLKFCFVYKYRQRFAHVARVIGERLAKDCSGLEAWRLAGMLTDDLSCCGTECAC